MDHQLKVDLAKKYLRERGKYVLDPQCSFKPTPSTDRFSIMERYGKVADVITAPAASA